MFNFIALCLLYMIPLFVLYAMGEFNIVNAPIAILTSAYVMIIGSFVPIPGASGGIEYGYYKFFGNFIKGSLLKASLLIWRTIS